MTNRERWTMFFQVAPPARGPLDHPVSAAHVADLRAELRDPKTTSSKAAGIRRVLTSRGIAAK